MTMRCAMLSGVLLVSSPFAAEPGFEFSGVMTLGEKTKLALTDPVTKATTWVDAGENFKGYTIARYDAKESAIFLKKSGQETRLPLVSPKTTDAARTASAPAAGNDDATAAAIRANLRYLAAAARQYQQERGVASVGYSELVGPDKLVKELKPVAGENYSTLNFGPNVTAVSVTTATGATVPLELSGTTPATANAASPTHAIATLPAPAVSGPVAATPGTVTGPTLATIGDAKLEPTGRPTVSPDYTVRTGDTWEKISAATGVPIQQLKQQNPSVLEGSALPVGQPIRVR